MNDDELVYRRVFRAPRELVWRCLTEPVQLAHFWGPTGMTTPGNRTRLRSGRTGNVCTAGLIGSLMNCT